MSSVERHIALCRPAKGLCFGGSLGFREGGKVTGQRNPHTRDKSLLKVGNAHEIHRPLIPAINAVGLSTIKVTVQFYIGIHTLPQLVE